MDWIRQTLNFIFFFSKRRIDIVIVRKPICDMQKFLLIHIYELVIRIYELVFRKYEILIYELVIRKYELVKNICMS